LILLIAGGISLFTGRPKTIDSIAVLPLKNLSDDPKQDYFVYGMTEALINELAQIRALRVISLTSVMQYKEALKPLPKIARELGVDSIIEGSVLQVGDRVRITAQLIGAKPERHLWAKSYERDLRDVLALQSEMAREIAREIKITITPEEEELLAEARPVDPEAYQLYLKANFQLTRLSEVAFKKAIEHYLQAIEKEPSYAPLYAGLAMAYTGLGGWHSSVGAKEVYSKAKEAALKALELDETVAEAYFALGRIRHIFEWNWSGADRAYKRGIELNPSSTFGRLGYANFLSAMGRLEESIAIGKQTLEIDPLLPAAYNELGFALHVAGRYEEALEQYLKGLELAPEFPQSHLLLASIYSDKGMYEETITHCQKLMSLVPNIPGYMSYVGYFYAMAGRRAEALKILDELKERSKEEYISVDVALIYVGLGEEDQALEWLEKAYDEHNVSLAWLKMDPIFDTLRDDPRFQDLLRRMNFPE
jgi:TolB-like protein/Flp pilus assembly protein TadD